MGTCVRVVETIVSQLRGFPALVRPSHHSFAQTNVCVCVCAVCVFSCGKLTAPVWHYIVRANRPVPTESGSHTSSQPATVSHSPIVCFCGLLLVTIHRQRFGINSRPGLDWVLGNTGSHWQIEFFMAAVPCQWSRHCSLTGLADCSAGVWRDNCCYHLPTMDEQDIQLNYISQIERIGLNTPAISWW